MKEWPTTVRFAYKTSSGVSERTVRLSGVSATYLRGYCTLRRAPRTFRIDRIIGNEVIDTETGEILTTR